MLFGRVLDINGFRMQDHILFELTKRCHYACKHCFTFGGSKMPEMNTEEVISVLSKLSEAGVENVTLSGGDPALRDDLPEIVKAARDYNIVPHVFSTLLSEAQLDKIKGQVGVFATSLDGPEEIHDRIRMHAGAYKDTIRLLNLLKANSLDFAIQSMITPESWQYIDWLIEKASEAGAYSLRLSHLAPQGRGIINNQLRIDDEKMNMLFDIVEHYNKSGNGKFTLFSNLVEIEELIEKPNAYKAFTLHILPNGNALPFLGVTQWSLGNIKEHSLVSIIDNIKASGLFAKLSNIVERTYKESISSKKRWVAYEDAMLSNLSM